MTRPWSRAVAIWSTVPPAMQDRAVGLAAVLPSGTVLGLAAWLTPDPHGMGTHRQLGLGACTMLSVSGIPCPMCGMTTTFSHLAHLQIVEGALNQPFGVALFLATLGAFAVGLSDLIAPRARWRRVLAWVERYEVQVAAGTMLGLLAGWAYKIATASTILSRFG